MRGLPERLPHQPIPDQHTQHRLLTLSLCLHTTTTMTVITIKKMSSSPAHVSARFASLPCAATYGGRQKLITMDNLPKFIDGICEMCHAKVKSTRDQTRHAKGHLSLEIPENIPKRLCVFNSVA